MTLPMIVFQAIFVSLALLVQVVLQLDQFRAQDLSGPLIAIGLLRELGPLTVGLAWIAVVAAFISQEQEEFTKTSLPEFFVVRYLAGAIVTGPLVAIATTIGFMAAALFAPVLGVTSTADFMEMSRQAIADKDIIVFLFKVGLVNPAIAVITGTIYASRMNRPPSFLAAQSVIFGLVAGTVANCLVTMAFYL